MTTDPEITISVRDLRDIQEETVEKAGELLRYVQRRFTPQNIPTMPGRGKKKPA